MPLTVLKAAPVSRNVMTRGLSRRASSGIVLAPAAENTPLRFDGFLLQVALSSKPVVITRQQKSSPLDLH